ncbi:hypothetical protein AMR42_12180 [Limnothrix sp. PR1529]|uniref:hypothetical protein n=1 Tax=Limnothrix sp. PR1529 TaxID=1704291 RepID=UPI00081E75A7|nr:hypothetical protein [Limnothrix sp. PR1529]OCQ94868.1 hypothetical protein BCR12_14805 [Limnothrix sp. P13C2]PIB09846.1 hypothetical protein AMR42_12180 [Limnothrix sp. PR1529]
MTSRNRPEIQLSDLTRRVGELESKIFGAGESVVGLLETLRAGVEQNSISQSQLATIESRLSLIEAQAHPAKQLAHLKNLSLWLSRLPGGLWGAIWGLVAIDLAIALAIDLMGPADLLRAFLGLGG